MCVDPTEKGISASETLDVAVSEPLEELAEDSDFDENVEIFNLERRNFEDVDGIDSDGD